MNRNIALDILKLSMALMVVGLHSDFLRDISPLWNFLTVHGIFRAAVPIFFLINGFYFYPVLLKNNQLYWFKRFFTLYIFWTIIYSYFWMENPKFPFYLVFLKNIIIGYYHLWYVPALLGAAMILTTVKNISVKKLIISIILTFICGVLMQYIGIYHLYEGSIADEILKHDFTYRNLLFLSYPFFCLGYLINKFSLYDNVSFRSIIVFILIGLFALLGESYVNFYQDGKRGGFDTFLSLMLFCPFVFLFFIKLNIPHKGKELALYSSSIYFIHKLVLILYQKYTDFGGTMLTLITIITSALLSYFIVNGNQRLKFML
ncbi:acyltransferase family protein [Vibrio sp. RC27]